MVTINNEHIPTITQDKHQTSNFQISTNDNRFGFTNDFEQQETYEPGFSVMISKWNNRPQPRWYQNPFEPEWKFIDAEHILDH